MLALAAMVAFATQAGRRAGAAKLIDYPASKAGISLTSEKDGSPTLDVDYGKVKIKSDQTEVDGIKFGKSFKNAETEKYYAKLTVEGGFKAGDVIKIAGAYNNADVKEAAIAVRTDLTKDAVWTTDNFINGKTSADEPAVQEYTLTEAAEALYLARKGGTATYITSLTIERVGAAVVSGDSLWSAEYPTAIETGIYGITLKSDKVTLSGKFAAGGKIRVGIDDITSTDDPLTKESATIQLFAGKTQLTEEAQIGKFEAPGVYEFTLTGAMVKAIAANDSVFEVTGKNFKTSKITYTAGTAKDPTSVWFGTAVNKLELPAYVFENMDVNVGSYIKIKATKTAAAPRRANAENDEIILKKSNGTAFADDELKIDEAGYNAIVLTDGAANELKTNGLVVEVKDNSAITKFTEVDVVVGKAITLTDTKIGTASGTTTVPSAAAPGQTVTIKPAPASGSVVLKVEPTYQVTTDEGTETKSITATKGKDESDNEIYTFTMPDYPVALKVTYAPAPEDITVTMDAAGDLSAAIATALTNKNPNAKSMTINLNAVGTYTLKDSIPSAGSVIITGADGAIIDASASSAPFIQLSKTPAVDFLPKSGTNPVEYTDYYGVDKIQIKDVKVTGLKNSIFYDNETKYCVVDFTIDNAVFELATEKVAANSALIAFKTGGAKDFTVNNSTFYGNNAVAKYFVCYNNSARIDRYGYNESGKYEPNKTTFTYSNNTFYKVLKSDGEWFNGSGLSNGTTYTVKDNIWVDCAKSGNMDYILSGRRLGSGATATWSNNTYWYNGAVATTSKDDSGSILVTDPEFVDAANGDFHLGVGSQQAKFQTGDPRWVTIYDPSQATPIDLTVEVEDGKEIAAAISEAMTTKQVDIVGNLTVKLGATSTIANPIEIGGVKGATLTLTGSGSNGSTIDASGLTDAFIKFSDTPAVDPVAIDASNNLYFIDNVNISNVTINDVPSYLVYNGSNNRYVVKDFTIDNAVVKLTTSTSTNALIRIDNNQSGVKDFTIKNSTFYQTGTSNVTYFVQYSQGDPARWKLDDDETWSFNYYNNTFYKVGTGNWANTSSTNNVKPRTIFNVEKNIWVDCGNGQIAQRMVNQQTGFKVTNFVSNTYWYNGAAVNQSSYTNGEEALTHDPGFVGAANGDFTLGAMTAQAEYQTGDPRWLVPYQSPENTDEMIALAEEIDKAQTLLGNSDTSVEPGASLAAAIQSATNLYNNTKYADQLPAVATETAALKSAETYFAGNVLGAEIVKAKSLYDQYKSDCASPDGANNFYYAIRRAESYDNNSAQYTGQVLNRELLRLIAAEEAFLTDAGIDPSTYVTGIEGIKADMSLEGAVIYDLNGKRVEKPGKGLYIVNGKKVIIK